MPINKKGGNMYDKLIERVEELFNLAVMANINKESIKYDNELADLIIKIKTIQALDTNAELIQASRRVSRN